MFREDGNAGVLTQVNERSFAAVSPQLTSNLLSMLYEDDGHEVYDQESLSAVIRELRRFGDLPTVAEICSVSRVAAQALTVGMRPGLSIDLGTLKPDGTPWNLEDDNDFRLEASQLEVYNEGIYDLLNMGKREETKALPLVVPMQSGVRHT